VPIGVLQNQALIPNVVPLVPLMNINAAPILLPVYPNPLPPINPNQAQAAPGPVQPWYYSNEIRTETALAYLKTRSPTEAISIVKGKVGKS
jgi:hypothetical protein